MKPYEERQQYSLQMAKELFGSEIEGWRFDYEQMSGTLAWNKETISVFVTPWWDNEDGLALTVMNNAGEVLEIPDNVPFDASGNIELDVAMYRAKAKHVIAKYGEKHLK